MPRKSSDGGRDGPFTGKMPEREKWIGKTFDLLITISTNDRAPAGLTEEERLMMAAGAPR